MSVGRASKFPGPGRPETTGLDPSRVTYLTFTLNVLYQGNLEYHSYRVGAGLRGFFVFPVLCCRKGLAGSTRVGAGAGVSGTQWHAAHPHRHPHRPIHARPRPSTPVQGWLQPTVLSDRLHKSNRYTPQFTENHVSISLTSVYSCHQGASTEKNRRRAQISPSKKKVRTCGKRLH